MTQSPLIRLEDCLRAEETVMCLVLLSSCLESRGGEGSSTSRCLWERQVMKMGSWVLNLFASLSATANSRLQGTC